MESDLKEGRGTKGEGKVREEGGRGNREEEEGRRAGKERERIEVGGRGES